MRRRNMRRSTAALAAAFLLLAPAVPALAGVCFTSGKVYVQQKVWDKAAAQLECARREEPENVQVYSLLALSRAQLDQYASAGAAFALGTEYAKAKKDEKRLKEIEQNRKAVFVTLFNNGVKALNRAGAIEVEANRTTGAGAQAAVEKERGEPKEFVHFKEGGREQEFWYYPEAGVAYHFSPDSDQPRQFAYKPFAASYDPRQAVTDTTTYPDYQGASALDEAAYYFTLAALVDPTSADVYRNLSYTYEALGRPTDAMNAAKQGLTLLPDDRDMMRNLRAAVSAKANRLFAARRFEDAAVAYREAIDRDPSNRIIYMSGAADSWYNRAAGLDRTDPARAAAYDSAAAAYMRLLDAAPAESVSIRENALYNSAVIYTNQENYTRAAEILDKAVTLFPNNKDLLSLAGQTHFQAGNPAKAETVLRRALAIDPKDKDVHQFLFLSLAKDPKKKDESVAEYTVYKALSEGNLKTGPMLKTWVDSADNRLGKGHQLKATLAKEGGYPDEVRTFRDGDKSLESWFYWNKGKAITFMDGQVFSQATFPPLKS